MDALKTDVLVVQEMTSLTGAQLFLSEVMNFTVPGTYAMAPFVDGPDSDNVLFYKKSTITFVQTRIVRTALRDIAEYTVRVRSGPGPGRPSGSTPLISNRAPGQPTKTNGRPKRGSSGTL